MTYTQAKECINELEREGLEELLDQYGEEVIEAALACDISPGNNDGLHRRQRTLFQKYIKEQSQ